MYNYFKDNQDNFYVQTEIALFKNNRKVNYADCILCQISQDEYKELVRKYNERIIKIETDKYLYELSFGG